MALGKTLDLCAAAYRKFCQRYRPQPKPERKSHWGSVFLERFKTVPKAQKKSPGQLDLWDNWVAPAGEILDVAKKFVLANCLNPDIAGMKFTDSS